MNFPDTPLTPQQVQGLVQLVNLTRAEEFNCGECLNHVGEFAERQLAGLSLSIALQRVEHHLSVCEECREEYETLKEILEAGQ